MMRALLTPAVAIILAAICGTAATAEESAAPGNTQAGRELALRSCASCHVVAAKQGLPPIPNYGPSFFAIAKRPGVTAASLRAFLAKPHPMIEMPDLNLTPAQIADVSAYLLSLRRSP